MNNMNNKRFIAILAVLLAFAVFALCSCSKNDEGGRTSDEGGEEKTTETGQDEGESMREAEITPDYLPEADYGGYEFNVLALDSTNPDYATWISYDIYAEAETGDLINDAVYRRNRYVEAKYNCAVKETKNTDYNNILRKTVNAGEDIYDLFYALFNDVTAVAASGYFCDLTALPNLDLSKPWWDQNARESLSMAGILFFSPCDLSITHNNTTSVIAFNKKLMQDHNMEYPYQSVKEGKWTIDGLILMSKDICADLNGDGIMDENDMYGYACYRDSALSLMHGAGGRIAEKGPDGLPVLTLNSERAINALGKAFDLMYAPSAFNIHKELEGKYKDYYPVAANMFIGNQTLFYWILLHDIELFRNMDADFGILPIPKYDEDQKNYGCTVNQYTSHAIAVPVTVQDTGRTTVILEALSAKSRYTLLPAYYDISLQRKFTRDEESADMLDIIFDSQVYDIGAIYNIGGYSWEIIAMTMKQNRDIVSLYEKKEKAALKDIEKIAQKYVEIVENAAK